MDKINRNEFDSFKKEVRKRLKQLQKDINTIMEFKRQDMLRIDNIENLSPYEIQIIKSQEDKNK